MTSRLPDFFIVGAGKSGTTSLYGVLKFHPSIFLPKIKECHFFSDSNFYYGAYDKLSFKDYLRMFNDAQDDQIIGECSTSYFICNKAASRIYRNNNKAKIIIILRYPISRAY